MIPIDPERKLKLVCFDLDGTLADTEPLHEYAKEKLIRSMGYTAAIDYPSYVGKPNRLFWDPILAALGRTETVEEMEKLQLEIIIETTRERRLPVSRGIPELLAAVKARGIPAAVCTSSNRFYADRMTEVLGLGGAFDFVVGGDEVPLRKPAPDVYLAALRRFGAAGGEALSIEDSAAGVASAKAAGLLAVGYHNPTSGKQDLSGADWQTENLLDLLL